MSADNSPEGVEARSRLRREDLARAPVSYRLTLTAAVAKAWDRPVLGSNASAIARGRNQSKATAAGLVERDVQHIARALGADVEVHAPRKRGTLMVGETTRPLTTVSP